MNQLTNQELLQELDKRIKNSTLKTEVVVNQVESETKSLLSYLDSKSLLLLIGITVGTTLLICYTMKLTTNSPTGCSLQFQENNHQIEIELKN